MPVSERDAAGLARPAPEAVRRPGSWRSTPQRSWVGPGLFTAACVAAFVCYLRMSSTVATNSDGASNALQAAALTYTLLVALAALLAKGKATGAEAWVRMGLAGGLLLAPQLGVGTQVLLLSPDHVGTVVPVLLAWLVLDRFGRRKWVPAAVGLLLAWALVADAIVLYVGIAPLLIVSLVRLVPRRRQLSAAWYELSLAGAALVALVVGLKAPALIHSLGGYSVLPAPQKLAAIGQLGGRAKLTAQGLLLLFGADFFGLHFGLQAGLVLLHLVGVALAVWAVCAAVRRFRRESDLVVQLLVADTLIIVAAYLLPGRYPASGTRTRWPRRCRSPRCWPAGCSQAG
jgi:hypothetical protein